MTTQAHILVIDDEPQILRALRTILTARQFQVSTAATGADGLALAATGLPDLIILDLSLPDMDGTQVCSQLRTWTQTPIIVLSVRDSERDKVTALDRGADDYLTKPFGIDELLARIRVSLRHASLAPAPGKTIVTAGPLRIKLTATEFKLLAYLAINAGRVLTHRSILTHVWDPADADHVEYLRVFIRQLRKKLENVPEHPKYLLSEPGIGYRFIADD
jgi:two-component system KDP operon response regulator KdpE